MSRNILVRSLVSTLIVALPLLPLAQAATAGSGACPEWENAIVFSRDDPVSGVDIFVVQPDGSGLVHLDNNPKRSDSHPQWTPDHCGIVYTAKVKGFDEEVRRIAPDGSGMETLVGGGDDDRDWNGSLSPDGRLLVYVHAARLPDGKLAEDDLWIVDLATGDKRQLTALPGDEHWASWSPAGDLILFKAEPEGNGDIFTIRPDGTGLTNLTQTRVGEGYPAISPDGQTIVYTSGGPTTEIFLMEVDGSNKRQMSHFGRSLPAGPKYLAFSPDGSRIVLSLSPGTGQFDEDLYVMRLDGKILYSLTERFSGRQGDGARDAWADW